MFAHNAKFRGFREGGREGGRKEGEGLSDGIFICRSLLGTHF